MNKWIVVLLAGMFLSGMEVVQATPPSSNYYQLVQSLDSIVTSAVLPIADERQLAMRAFSPASGQAVQVLAVAREMLGRPVVWGEASPLRGFDCSGLVQYAFRQAGISLPRTADLQFLVGRTVLPSMLQPGDLVYFTTYEPGASHVGIYIGNEQFIHTSFSQGVVAVGSMNDPYFGQRYYGAKRVL